jgi:hypothetical protein
MSERTIVLFLTTRGLGPIKTRAKRFFEQCDVYCITDTYTVFLFIGRDKPV